MTKGVHISFAEVSLGSAGSLTRHFITKFTAESIWTPVSTAIHSLNILLQESSVVFLLHL